MHSKYSFIKVIIDGLLFLHRIKMQQRPNETSSTTYNDTWKWKRKASSNLIVIICLCNDTTKNVAIFSRVHLHWCHLSDKCIANARQVISDDLKSDSYRAKYEDYICAAFIFCQMTYQSLAIFLIVKWLEDNEKWNWLIVSPKIDSEENFFNVLPVDYYNCNILLINSNFVSV